MRLLLDTHALLWALTDNPKLSRKAAALISDGGNQILISPVSAYEICAKHALGKLPEAEPLAIDFEGEIAPLNVEWLPITPAHSITAGKLDPAHRDPFDRLLAGQALVERLTLLSSDQAFDAFDVERLW